jgi:lysophospholipase L1-like esterase
MSSVPRFSGRVDFGERAGPRFAWSGTSIHARFSGRSIAVRLRGSSDYFSVLLDGAAMPTLAANPSQEVYPLGAELPPGEHEISITKRTEALVGETQFLGFELAPGARLLSPPEAPSRRIEFVGDSITAGFGNLGRDRSCPFSPDTEDFTLSYAALTARALEAEPVAVCWSGRGVCRNWQDEPGDPMPVLYDRVLPARPESRWDFSCWVPHVVVINLGTNDFSSGSPPEREFVDTYAALLRRIRFAYPNVFVFCTLGPMLSGSGLRDARAFVPQAVDRIRDEGLTRIRVLEFPEQSAENGFGCDGHPSQLTHRLMATQLSTAVRQEQGW